MSLAERLAMIKKSELEENSPPEEQAIMERATEALIRSGSAARALGLGDLAPDFELPGTSGQRIHTATLRERGPLVLSFYRGVW